MLRWFVRAVRPSTRLWFDIVVPASCDRMVGDALPLRTAALVIVGILCPTPADVLQTTSSTSRSTAPAPYPSRFERALITGEASPPATWSAAGSRRSCLWRLDPASAGQHPRHGLVLIPAGCSTTSAGSRGARAPAVRLAAHLDRDVRLRRRALVSPALAARSPTSSFGGLFMGLA